MKTPQQIQADWRKAIEEFAEIRQKYRQALVRLSSLRDQGTQSAVDDLRDVQEAFKNALEKLEKAIDKSAQA